MGREDDPGNTSWTSSTWICGVGRSFSSLRPGWRRACVAESLARPRSVGREGCPAPNTSGPERPTSRKRAQPVGVEERRYPI